MCVSPVPSGSRGPQAPGEAEKHSFLILGPRSTVETTFGDIFFFLVQAREEASGTPRPLQTPVGKCPQEEGAHPTVHSLTPGSARA